MSEKVKRQPKTGYRPSLWTRIAKTLRGKKVNRGIADNIFTALFLLIMGAFMALPLLYVIPVSYTHLVGENLDKTADRLAGDRVAYADNGCRHTALRRRWRCCPFG